MNTIEFNYAHHTRRDIPVIPISLRTGGKWRKVWVYLDSGSFYRSEFEKPIFFFRYKREDNYGYE